MAQTDFKQRLVAILAADATGYSRLMSLDEQATVDALDAARAVFRTQIEASQGRVIDMAGDSVLAVFDTATGAMAAALAIQVEVNIMAEAAQEHRRMRFRIGVHLGDVIEKADGTVYGDGVNIAARLEGLAEPGGVMVSDSVHVAVHGRLEAVFVDQGEQTVKNIAHPVRAWSVCAAAAATTTPPAALKPPHPVGEIDLSLPHKPSIAVLPFANMSGEREQEYFADGVTEDIITELSRFQQLFVIARNSSFTYKNRAVDVKRVGKELGVRYVLEGSIRRSGNRVRVTAQLIDAASGNHLWAERYDRVLEDIFDVQDELMACIVAAIAPQVDVAEQLRGRLHPKSVNAYEIATKALASFMKGWQGSNRAANETAIALAQEALAIDSESLHGLVTYTLALWHAVVMKFLVERGAAWQEAMSVSERIITIAKSYQGHGLKALLLATSPSGPRWEEALPEARLAYESNPHDCWIGGIYGMVLSNADQPLEGIRVLEHVLRISPRDPGSFNIFTDLAYAHLHAGQYRQGLQWADKAISAAPGFAQAHLASALLYMALEQVDKAGAALASARHLVPELVEARLRHRTSPPRRIHGMGYDTLLRIAAGLENP